MHTKIVFICRHEDQTEILQPIISGQMLEFTVPPANVKVNNTANLTDIIVSKDYCEDFDAMLENNLLQTTIHIFLPNEDSVNQVQHNNFLG